MKQLRITFFEDVVKVVKFLDEANVEMFSYDPLSAPEYLTELREGRLAIGGLLGVYFYFFTSLKPCFTLHKERTE